MIKGLGHDIVDVKRIERSLGKGDKFVNLVFHEKEITYCTGKAKPAESFAGRFAAKEAFLKALGTGWRGVVALHEIVIVNDELGKPQLMLEGRTQEVLQDYASCTIHVSISHTDHHASAVVIIENNG